MTIRQIRLSSQAKDQLIRLKTRTGLQHWNVLCRWAFCVSLAEPTPPTPIEIPADSNVEMSWHVFGGEWHEVYLALLKERCIRDGLDTEPETVHRQFRCTCTAGSAIWQRRIASAGLATWSVAPANPDFDFDFDDPGCAEYRDPGLRCITPMAYQTRDVRNFKKRKLGRGNHPLVVLAYASGYGAAAVPENSAWTTH